MAIKMAYVCTQLLYIMYKTIQMKQLELINIQHFQPNYYHRTTHVAYLTGRATDLVDKPHFNFIFQLITKHQCRPYSNHFPSTALDGHLKYESSRWYIQKLKQNNQHQPRQNHHYKPDSFPTDSSMQNTFTIFWVFVLTDKLTDRPTDKPTDRPTDRQTDRHSGRQTKKTEKRTEKNTQPACHFCVITRCILNHISRW